MSMNMYTFAGDCPSNEKLALRIQGGDKNAAELLISQNEGYITELALKHGEWCDLEDLKQEGDLPLLEAAKRFDPAYGTKLLTYATPALESAIMDNGSHDSLTISIPPNRYHQLRKVAYVCSAQLQRPQRRGESIQDRAPQIEERTILRRLWSVAFHSKSH